MLEELASQLLYLVNEKGGESQAGQVLLCVPVIVFEMVALCFQCVKRFVLNFPSGASSSHDFRHVLPGEFDIGNPGVDVLLWKRC